MGNFNFAHEGDLTIDILIKRVEAYYPDADFEMIRKAYEFAATAHQGQKRSSGEDYIIHPLNVASTLTQLRMDIDSIIAGFLHDVVEDCEVTEEMLRHHFSESVVNIVVGLTKISKIKFKTREENQAENFRKMVVAMAKDIRVIIVKLADRMHNMRTLQYISEEKQRSVAQETLDIYVPLASRLGIHSVKAELEDLCLRFLHPETYYLLAEKIAMKKSEREKYIKDVALIVKEKLNEYSVKADILGRPKHFYSIYKKMVQRSLDFEQIQDILAFRIITNNITQCYKSLGIIHSCFTPIPGRFKDYIAIPKVNNYQSLHTTVIGPKAERIEIQIRTYEMDEVAETGVAAHWKYKEGIGARKQKLDWVEELLEYNKSVKSSTDFLDAVKNDLDAMTIFIFTPTGDVKELKAGATPLDFAYAIHTEVGNLCVGAKVNSKMVPLKYRLKSGDVVEILTSKTQTPSKDWLKIVKTSRAKTKIKQWLLKTEREKHKKFGEELLEKCLKVYGLSIKTLRKSNDVDRILRHFTLKNEDELLYQVGSSKISPKEILSLLPEVAEMMQEQEAELEKIQNDFKKVNNRLPISNKKDNAIIVEGLEDVLVRMAKCCNPIPGDPIVGHITRGRGITVHTKSCKHIALQDGVKIVKVDWNNNFSFRHPVNIRVITLDRPGTLAKISKTINNLGINIRSAIARSLPDQKGNFIFEVEVKDYNELLKVISMIESGEEVLTVTRI